MTRLADVLALLRAVQPYSWRIAALVVAGLVGFALAAAAGDPT